ncbi:hypothetical protein XELAEV_18021493mg [Xenopus laevis]|uniref:Uncharacterized protein n=1 Tax=Xenopus laevis TaxID=8355 RepID=A0A974D9B4_XENLA|nr:hypothetical protein XELAEV_18021493mg [Xenopus laevis]
MASLSLNSDCQTDLPLYVDKNSFQMAKSAFSDFGILKCQSGLLNPAIKADNLLLKTLPAGITLVAKYKWPTKD